MGACSHPNPQNTDSGRPLRFETIEQFAIGRTSQEDAIRGIGQPDRTFSLEIENKVVWIYLVEWNFTGGKAEVPRATLTFDAKSGTLQSKSWDVYEGEREKTLDGARSRFKSALFKRIDAEQTNPHAVPDEIYFVDEKQGISIEYRKARGEVSSISWWNPSDRSVAESRKKKNGIDPRYKL
ncbi:MAG: hypothetical protein HYW49_03520 [Deltaproteobacteria bacterium]|nr:hypothetical protein [Deltaproteobacteria bacterium]